MSWVDGCGAQGRFYVVHFDGRREVLTVLDAMGRVLATGPNEKSFTFTGYDPDYLGGLEKVQTHVEVGDGQIAHLDTAPHDATRVSCIMVSATGPDDPSACVVSATATTPAYVRVHLEPGGCPAQCGVVGAETEREAWPWLALLPLAAGLSRRVVRRRRTP